MQGCGLWGMRNMLLWNCACKHAVPCMKSKAVDRPKPDACTVLFPDVCLQEKWSATKWVHAGKWWGPGDWGPVAEPFMYPDLDQAPTAPWVSVTGDSDAMAKIISMTLIMMRGLRGH